MTLSAEILHPLTASTVEYEYCLDRPLRTLATRYTLKDESAQTATGKAEYSLLFCSGISLRAAIVHCGFSRLNNTCCRTRDVAPGD